jgi:hypothetical protein
LDPQIAALPAPARTQANAAAGALTNALKMNAPRTLPDFEAAIDALEDIDAELRPPVALLAIAGPPIPPVAKVAIVTSPAERRAGNAIRFRIELPAAPSDGSNVHWNFGDGATATGGDVHHAFLRRGVYTVTATRGSQSFSLECRVMPSELVQQHERLIAFIKRNDRILTVVAAVLAALTGLSQLYYGQIFGTVNDYVLALIWGFGVERSTRGFAAIFDAIRT